MTVEQLPSTQSITTVGVLGFGIMGAGIVQIAAAAGHPTIAYEPTDEALEAGLVRVTAFLDSGVTRGKVTAETRDEILALITTTTDLSDLTGADLVIEAVTEDLAVKTELFGRLDKVVSAQCIIASNTSALAVTELAATVSNPGRFAGLHFFNPAPVMTLVEVIPALQTDRGTVEALMAWSAAAGKDPIEAKDRPGFLVNKLFMPYINDVLQAFDDGLASAEDIDVALHLGLGYPMGPLELLDLMGLDTHHHATSAAYDATRDPRFAPPPLLTRLVQAGWHGNKTGRGVRVGVPTEIED
jgi:3-hydroxybutyryl-CoA dehydrogenase